MGAGTQEDGVPRPKRKKITQHQLERLVALFAVTDSPSFGQREDVGRAVEPTMTSREVQVSLVEPVAGFGSKLGGVGNGWVANFDHLLVPLVTSAQ